MVKTQIQMPDDLYAKIKEHPLWKAGEGYGRDGVPLICCFWEACSLVRECPDEQGLIPTVPDGNRCWQICATCGIEADVENGGFSGAFSIARRRNC